MIDPPYLPQWPWRRLPRRRRRLAASGWPAGSASRSAAALVLLAVGVRMDTCYGGGGLFINFIVAEYCEAQGFWRLLWLTWHIDDASIIARFSIFPPFHSNYFPIYLFLQFIILEEYVNSLSYLIEIFCDTCTQKYPSSRRAELFT